MNSPSRTVGTEWARPSGIRGLQPQDGGGHGGTQQAQHPFTRGHRRDRLHVRRAGQGRAPDRRGERRDHQHQQVGDLPLGQRHSATDRADRPLPRGSSLPQGRSHRHPDRDWPARPRGAPS
ncbi:hypothetical protein SGPA1_12728 [Streptomyces misionensis JCM 4497]